MMQVMRSSASSFDPLISQVKREIVEIEGNGEKDRKDRKPKAQNDCLELCSECFPLREMKAVLSCVRRTSDVFTFIQQLLCL